MSHAIESTSLSVEQARAESVGYQALEFAGKRLPLQVLCSAGGHYIGTADADGPVSREAEGYFRSYNAAEHALKTGRWQQRRFP